MGPLCGCGQAYSLRVDVVQREKNLKIDRPFRAGGFVSLTALWAEGCGGGFAAIFKVSVTGLPSRPHRHSEP